MTGVGLYLSSAWYSGARWLHFLLPVEYLYRFIIFTRRLLYQKGLLQQKTFPVPIVVVGNITVGGTGKTPLVIALVNSLKSKGFKPGVVSRGYGSNAPAYPYAVDADSVAKYSGDEPLLIAIRTAAPVVIDANRTRAVEYLLNQFSCDVVITDDGMQHYKLARDIECVVVDGEREIGNGRCLPMGPLREPVSRLDSVDFIIRNGLKSDGGPGFASRKSQDHGASNSRIEMPNTITPQSLMFLESRVINSLDDSESYEIDRWSQSSEIHAIAGIGNPKRFFSNLKKSGFKVIEHAFSDHHNYTANDFDFGDELPVIMTEKDAVKARSLNPKSNCWYVPVEAKLDDEFWEVFYQRLEK